MGFDLTKVVSDDKHYGAFICKLCTNLVSLDAVVTTPCSHPFCRSCITDWAQTKIDTGRPCSCPKCEKDLTNTFNHSGNISSNNESAAATTTRFPINDSGTSILVQPLGEAQPLALEVLKLIQVTCRTENGGADCEWRGDYGTWQGHCELHHHHQQQQHNGENGSSNVSSVGLAANNMNGDSGVDKQQYASKLSDPSLFAEQKQKASVQETSGSSMSDIKFVPPNNEVKNNERQYRSTSNLFDKVDTTDYGAVDLMDGSSKRSNDISDSMNELQMSAGNMEWNSSFSHNSFTAMSPSKQVKPIATVDEEKSEDLVSASHLLDEDSSKALSDQGISTAEAIERSEKLKKQANAKFNKGDFEGARSLYSDGITVITSISLMGKEECNLVATLFSNRAVTYFREKVFDKCIEDCDKALKYEATFEKSYIRKWRALMALGNFEAACGCLEEAHQQIPSSRRVKDELVKAREQRDVLSAVNTMIDGGNLEKAKETIKPLTKESDNIGLLLVAAMADAGLGLTEPALDKVDKALRFNPNHAEALQLRGLVLFLSGEMEKGVRLLHELHGRHVNNAEIAMKLEQCQNTLSAFSKGRAYAKRSRYKEAAEQFTFSMDDQSLPLPIGTALYCLIKIERAEALLLAKHYAEALKDCKDALDSQPENAEACALKAEIYMCLGRAAEAKEELAEVRQTWGSDNLVIEESYRKANFEEKVRRVDDELMQLINDVEAGVAEKVIIDGRDGLVEKRSTGMHQSERRHGSSDRRSDMGSSKRTKSHRSLNKASEKDRRSNRKDRGGNPDRKSRRDRSRARGEGSSRTMNTQVSSRTLNTTATGTSARTLNTRGTNGASHRAKRTTRKKSSRALKVEKGLQS